MKEKITVELEPTEVFKIVQALGEQPAHSSAQLYLKMCELWSSYKEKITIFNYNTLRAYGTQRDRRVIYDISRGSGIDTEQS